ncbi:class I SAM-dependent methyltransferase [Legionella longbeachae]|uniref:Putative methyltransferase n=1 Tax=Legionella longbeachae serogroup 1 (strain NSW150) TaxID=661367 RepID=D3HSX4_LEGLN|nr:class I SAM-dependent methyltransferase [Legionella longbeachae]VEE02505.1 methyltransferase [Legionella oakridgensis]HBD7398767.1 class I SAM-dependent methyltransferase [Legionella pneumophila]ARB91223.1 class I SAM-dependent methyltransferase [Legionella longbeachae]ARM32353.1 class I SAM-dependent methyltransferase [Legionella longbeachae]EEZ93380.1 methyltransferase domain-containing protein [Legionella longbeachae D-4968]
MEIGSGNGEFWQHSAKQELQSNVCITDLSEKMLEECKRNLSNVKIKAHYQLADIDKLPFGGETFNGVLAHNVIYHAEPPKEALIKIYDILQSGGFLCMSVLNYGANKSIWKIANSIESQVPAQSFTSRFTNIEADNFLGNIFNQVEKREYFNTLRFESPEPIINMVKSSPAVKPLRLSDNLFTLFNAKIEEQIEDNGYFESELNASLYLCRKNG